MEKNRENRTVKINVPISDRNHENTKWAVSALKFFLGAKLTESALDFLTNRQETEEDALTALLKAKDALGDKAFVTNESVPVLEAEKEGMKISFFPLAEGYYEVILYGMPKNHPLAMKGGFVDKIRQIWTTPPQELGRSFLLRPSA